MAISRPFNIFILQKIDTATARFLGAHKFRWTQQKQKKGEETNEFWGIVKSPS